MNIFFLDTCPRTAARHACNQHVTKMISEAALMLSAAHWYWQGTKTEQGWWHPNLDHFRLLSRPAYLSHPCTIWAREKAENYNWVRDWYDHLNLEFVRWRGRDHAAWSVRHSLLSHPPGKMPGNRNLKSCEGAPFCMPDHCKAPGDLVLSYRHFYATEKAKFASWEGRGGPPEWYRELRNELVE